ncbi:putative phosphoserine phosphatase [Smittium mucronatum]|uniref:phosphoserine phosphatase n=1 Tax=Smittium mucronatum TaxID=133383 RepID=A0A1R0GTF5_9FUNG|nr:putative phosphoserine phosphatase [Smittium mucronatum]
MKFEQYYLEQLSQFPSDSILNSVSYSDLRSYLESHISCFSVDLLRSFPKDHVFEWDNSESEAIEVEDLDFKTDIGTRLFNLSKNAPGFISLLDKESEKFNNFVSKIASSHLSNVTSILDQSQTNKSPQPNSDGSHISTLIDILENVSILEDYVFLNFAAVVKILKRFDKHSGIKIRDPYIMRFKDLLETTNNHITTAKAKIEEYLNHVPEFQKETATQNSSDSAITTAHISNSDSLQTSGDKQSLPNRINHLIKKRSFTDNVEKLNRVAISLRGPHGTDIIGGLLECCASHKTSVLDFSFSRLHHNVVFGALVQISGSVADLFNSLAKTARKWDGVLTFDVQNTKLHAKQISGSLDYRLNEAPYKDRLKYVATVLNQDGLSSEFLDKLVKFFLERKISIEQMKRLDLRDFLNSIEFTLSIPNDINPKTLRKEVFLFSTKYRTDIALQEDNVFRRHKRLVVFDMDSTLIQQEVIDEIARYAGVVDKVSEITELAMTGAIDFKESLKRRVMLLKGTPANVLEEVRKKLVFTEGAYSLCRALKIAGFKLAVISGGFIPLAKFVKNELGLDYAFANTLETSNDGKFLTGYTKGPIVDAERKAELLDVIAQAEGIVIDQVVAVGDGANDLKMLAAASLGIAFNAKPKVQEAASIRINQSSLVNVLYLMGFSEKEAIELQSV